MRQPTSEERTKEASFLFGSLADAGITALIVVVAITSGSLTMLSEAVRTTLMLAASFYGFWVMRAVHRERLSRFEYGVGKIEQLVWAIIGLSLLFAAFWVANRVVATLLSPGPAAGPLALALAAMVNAINLVINLLGWYAMHVAARNDLTGVFGAQLRARLTMLLSSLFLQVTLTVAALAKDPAVALGLDCAGAVSVVLLMLKNGLPMVTQALPDLLDAPASDDLKKVIRSTVASVLPEEEVVSIRTRRAANRTFAEVAVTATAFSSLEHLNSTAHALNHALARHDHGIDLTVVVAPIARRPSGATSDAEENAGEALKVLGRGEAGGDQGRGRRATLLDGEITSPRVV